MSMREIYESAADAYAAIETLRAQVVELTTKVAQGKKLYELTLANVIHWMKLHEQAESLAAATFERTKQRAVERLQALLDEALRDADAAHTRQDYEDEARHQQRAFQTNVCIGAARNLPPEEPRK